MSALKSFRVYSQTPACQVCVLVLATSTVAWCIKRHLSKTDGSTMAPPSESTAHCNAGPSSEPSTITNRLTYADALKSTNIIGSNIQFKKSNESLQASLQDPHSPLSPMPLSAVSVVQKVLDTPELLAMILAKVPLASDRRAMSVSRQFWEVLNPNAERHLHGIKEALGLKFSRSIESMTDCEYADVQRFMHLPFQLFNPRMDWLVNVELDCTCPLGTTFLKIKPFVLNSTKGCLALGTFQINLRLNAEGIDGRYTEWKGVGAFRYGREKLWSNGDLVSRNWMDMKLLKFPFKVLVSVAVDFRTGMGAPRHPEGACNVQGCQVGLHGVQVRAFF